MLIATAGHVDHGKTVLIRALTGVDTDRLPEEKRRGLSIDLGFAYRDLGDGSILGFIDVPGHERFVGNMLAGVAGIDFGLLVVAADDGIMPQTREHLAILNLLGIERGAVAVTKVDAVSRERIDRVAQEIRALVATTSLSGAELFEVSALTGTGVSGLATHLIETNRRLPALPVAGEFRLAVDRRFTIAGAGLVVTGTVFSGQVRVGDSVRLLPSGIEARVRGVHSQNRETERGRAGERCALNLGGTNLSLDRVSRGDWVMAARVDWTTRHLDARLKVLPTETRALTHWTPVHVHAGAVNLPGRIAVLEGRRIEPGASALVQIVLERETNAMHGDRFILRDQSARRTLGGGTIIDPRAAVRGRAREERLAWLRHMEAPAVEDALSKLIDSCTQGVDLEHFAAVRNLTIEEANQLFDRTDMVQVTGRRSRLAFAPRRWREINERIEQTLAAWHEAHPERVGPGEAVLASAVKNSAPSDVARFAIQQLVAAGAIERDGPSVRLPGHQPRLPPGDAALWRNVSRYIDAESRQPPVVSDLATKLGVAKPVLAEFLGRAAARGQLVKVADNRYLHPGSVAALAAIAEALAEESDDQSFDAKTYRDRAGIGRNFTIELLEYFDRLGLTRRIGDSRRMARPSEELFA